MAEAKIQLTDELRRRVAAARAYAGGLSQEKLAQRIGVGRMTVVRIEDGNRPDSKPDIKRMELREIAETTGLPVEFFTADFERLREMPASLAERLDALEDAVRRPDADGDGQADPQSTTPPTKPLEQPSLRDTPGRRKRPAA